MRCHSKRQRHASFQYPLSCRFTAWTPPHEQLVAADRNAVHSSHGGDGPSDLARDGPGGRQSLASFTSLGGNVCGCDVLGCDAGQFDFRHHCGSVGGDSGQSMGLVAVCSRLGVVRSPVAAVSGRGGFFDWLGLGPITPASSHLLARTTPAHQMALVFSIKQTGVPVGAMVAGAVVPSLLLLLDWQVTLLVVALVCSASALLSETIRAEFDLDLNPESKLDWGSLIFPIRMVLSHRPLATMAACSFMFSMAQMSLMTYLVTYLHEDLSYTMVSAGLYLSVTQIGGIGGRIAWGYVADRWLGAQPTLVLLAGSMAVSAFATAVFLPLISTWAVWIILFVFGASAIGWNGVYLAEVARQAPAGHASTATGGTLAITFLGVVIGPPLFGMLSTVFGTYSAGYLALVPTSTLCGLVLFFNHRQQTRSKIQVN